MVNDVKPGGVFLINCQWDADELSAKMPAEAKRYIAKNNIQLYTVNAIDLPPRSASASVPIPSFSQHSSHSPRFCPRLRLSAT